ncbi:MAG: ABC transporter substrate-binding protein [Armatimonadetes bacterium]|jgi:ribose transport system substrate-binding protein|nr:ABC transporter substrate-binding protein [Armatimonadota bacterium]
MKSAFFLIPAVVLLTVAGCGPKTTQSDGTAKPPTPGQAKLRIAVIPKGTTHEFWKSIHAGADKAAKEDGVEIIWKGPLKEDDRDSQIKVVEDFIVDKVSGMVLAPLDDTALRTPVSEAVKSGIPVVIMDSALKGEDYTSFVATDNFKGGVLAGKRMVELLAGNGRVVMMRYQEGSASTHEREEGFLSVMKNEPAIQVVSSNQYGGATTESAQKTGENLLARYGTGPGRVLDGIFCPNESTTFGMLRALQDGGHAGYVRFVGFDSSPKLVDALKAGEIHGLVLQNPYKMGYTGVKTVVAHLRGEKVQKRIDTGASLATKANMDTPEIKELLEPPRFE